MTMLIAEHKLSNGEPDNEESPGPLPDAIVAHLDKSHVTVHTYPESHPYEGISTFRADIDVPTCGFTRDVDGTKHYIDHDINSIQNYLTEDTQNAYQMIDVNVYQENLFHTKMMLKNFDLDNYVFGVNARDLGSQEAQSIEDRLRREMLEIFYSRNVE